MPIDKLEVLCKTITDDFWRIARRESSRGGYAHFIDLNKTEFRLPVLLYCGGIYSGIHKIVFDRVSRLSLRRIKKILRLICGKLRRVKIYRIDWAIDIPGISAWGIHQHCRVSGVQKSAFFRSRLGDSFYPHFSHTRKILIYDKASQGKLDHTSASYKRSAPDSRTRLEVQLSGTGLPFRKFTEIGRYAGIDLLEDVIFLQFRPLRKGLKPLQLFAAIGMQSAVKEIGLQAASKRVPAANWAYMIETFFEPVSEGVMPDIRSLMKEEVRFWLDGGFPRPPETENAR